MSLVAAELAAVVTELAPTWTGAQIQKIHMRGPRTMTMKLRIPGATGYLRASVEPGSAHLCVVEERGAADEVAGAFCMLARKRLKGARLARFEQINGDRIVALGGPRGVLFVEMTGRQGRLVLCDEASRVLALSPREASRLGLEPGQPWSAPPFAGGASRPPRFLEGAANRAVVALYGDSPRTVEGERSRVEVRRRIKGKLRRASRLVEKIEADLRRVGEPDELLHRGELLKANLHRVPRGTRTVTLDDWQVDGGQVRIDLDPRLGPVENLERIFAKARKARRGREVARARLEEAKRERARLIELLEGVEDLDEAGLRALSDAMGASARPGSRRAGPRPKSRRPFLEFTDQRGRPILVGRSAGDNDTLTLRIAKPGDLWLHARDVHGSHVVVPLDRSEEIDGERLLDAATLAVYFSDSRGEDKAEVRYTPRRYLQKPRGAPRGAVLVLREKVLNLRVEPERLERVLSTRRDG